MVSQVQSAQQKAGDLVPSEGEAPRVPRLGGSKLYTCFTVQVSSWVTPVLLHATGPSLAQGPRGTGYSLQPLPELNLCIKAAQHSLTAPGHHLESCQIAEATAMMGTCQEATCRNAGQAPKPTFASVVFPTMNAVLAARTRPAMKGSLSQPADSEIPTQSGTVSSARYCQTGCSTMPF